MLAFDRARKILIEEIQQWAENPSLGSTFHSETLESTNEIIMINKLGMLTFDSQQGRILYGNVPKNLKLYAKLVEIKHAKMDENSDSEADPDVLEQEAQAQLEREYLRRGGRFDYGIVEKERAYLDGIVSRTIADALADWLNQQSNFVATYTPSSPESAEEILDQYAPKSIGVTYSIESGISPYRQWPLVRKSASPLNANRPSASITIELTDSEKEQLDRDYVVFQVLDARYGHSVTQPDGLFEVVVQGLKLIGSGNVSLRDVIE